MVFNRLLRYVYLLYALHNATYPKLPKGDIRGLLESEYRHNLFLMLSLVLVHIISNRARYGVSQYLWFAFISCLYGLILYIVDVPEEQVHFIEYGIFSGLIYIALTHDIHNNLYVYFFTVFIVFVFGAVDEVIQWILPNRIFDIRDILINGIAGILVQLLIAMVISKRKAILISHGKDYVGKL